MDTLEKVREIISEQLEIDGEDITADTAIQDDLGADSLDAVDLVMNLEEAFDIEIAEEALDGFKTVGDVVRFIDENLPEDEEDEDL